MTPTSSATTGASYDTAWARTPVARAVRSAFTSVVMRPAVRVLGTPAVAGTGNLSGLAGPCIIAPNHLSHADTPVVVAALPAAIRRRLAVAAAADNFFTSGPVSAMSALLVGAIPMERNKVARRSLEVAAGLLDTGWNVLLYPEGTRSIDGDLQEFRGGAAWLALRCGVPIVPVHVTGTNQLLPRGARRPHRAACTVTFGPPLVAEPDERARQLTSRLHQAVASLAAT